MTEPLGPSPLAILDEALAKYDRDTMRGVRWILGVGAVILLALLYTTFSVNPANTNNTSYSIPRDSN